MKELKIGEERIRHYIIEFRNENEQDISLNSDYVIEEQMPRFTFEEKNGFIDLFKVELTHKDVIEAIDIAKHVFRVHMETIIVERYGMLSL